MTRSLQISCVFHALLLLAFIRLGDRFIPAEKLMIVDFTLEDPIVLTGSAERFAEREQTAAIRKEVHVPKGPGVSGMPRDEALPGRAEAAPSVYAASVRAQPPADNGAKVQGEMRPREIAPLSSQANSDGPPVSPQQERAKSVSAGLHQDPQETGGAGYLKANFSYIKELINRELEYPRTARRMGWQGRVRISFTILASGESSDIRVLESSGKEVLDRKAVEAVKSASPFPRPPSEARIIVPVVFRLN